MKNYSNKEELVEDLENIKKEQRIINTNEKDDIDKQAEKYNIIVDWHKKENNSNYFKEKNIKYNIEGYKEEKIYRTMRLANINEH